MRGGRSRGVHVPLINFLDWEASRSTGTRADTDTPDEWGEVAASLDLLPVPVNTPYGE